MKHVFRTLLVVAMLAGFAFGQASETSTTTTAAVGSNDQILNVSSATGFSASTSSVTYVAFADREAMKIVSVNGTQIGVIRGWNGTQGKAHISGVTVYTGRGDYFLARDPNGACTSGNYAMLPTHSLSTGSRWNCDSTLGYWVNISPASGSTLALGVAGTVVGEVDFYNATSGSIALKPATGALGTVTLSLPAATDTLVGKATTDILTNKTLTGATVTTAGLGFTNATSGTITVAPPTGALGTVTNTLPAISGGLVAGFSCGDTGTGSQTCSATAVNALMHAYNGRSTLSSNAATITFPVAFTSSTSYFCVAQDVTTRANPVQMVPASASTATITNTTGASDSIQWLCMGQ